MKIKVTRQNVLLTLVVAFAAIWVGWQATRSWVRFFNNREARQAAEAWFLQAQQDAGPDMTEQDAIDWLRRHGVRTTYRGKDRWFNGQYIADPTISGFLKVSEESLWTEPMTAELWFHFDAEGRFKTVELSILPYNLSGSD